MNVNCHVIVGLGETDRDLFNLFFQLRSEQIAGYLFAFNPEPGTATQDLPRQPLHRHRRVQLVKYLIENYELSPAAITYDENGGLAKLDAPETMLNEACNSVRYFAIHPNAVLVFCRKKLMRQFVQRLEGKYFAGHAWGVTCFLSKTIRAARSKIATFFRQKERSFFHRASADFLWWDRLKSNPVRRNGR